MSTIRERLPAATDQADIGAPRGGSGLLLATLSLLPLLLVGAWFVWAAQSPATQLLDATFLFLCH